MTELCTFVRAESDISSTYSARARPETVRVGGIARGAESLWVCSFCPVADLDGLPRWCRPNARVILRLRRSRSAVLGSVDSRGECRCSTSLPQYRMAAHARGPRVAAQDHGGAVPFFWHESTVRRCSCRAGREQGSARVAVQVHWYTREGRARSNVRTRTPPETRRAEVNVEADRVRLLGFRVIVFFVLLVRYLGRSARAEFRRQDGAV